MPDDQRDTTPDRKLHDADRNPSDQAPDPRNGATGGIDGVTKNQDDDAQ